MSIVEKIERVRSQYNVSAKSLIAMVGISAATYMRWKRRLHRGDEPLRKPGVKKTEPIDLGELRRRIGSLRHGKRRTAGTGQL